MSTLETLANYCQIDKQDLLQLHALGLLDALFEHAETSILVQTILDQEYPDNISTGYQRAVYRLTLEFAHEQILAKNLLSSRVHHLWTARDQKFLEATADAREAYRIQHPKAYQTRLEKEARHQKGELQPEPVPRLIDRIRRVPKVTAENYFRQLSAVTTAHQYYVLKLSYTKGLTISQIAKQRGCGTETVSTLLQRGFRAAADYTGSQLVPSILGKAPLGELC